jgi:hypothetical protein
MVSVDRKVQSDHRANGLQLWQRDIEQWENIISRFSSYGRPEPYGVTYIDILDERSPTVLKVDEV